MEKSTIKYRIISLDPQSYSVTVRFYSVLMNEEKLAVRDGYGHVKRLSDGSPERCRTDYTLNLKPGTSEAELHKRISQSAPFGWFDLQEAIADPDVDTSMGIFTGLVGKEFEAVRPEDTRVKLSAKPSGPPPSDFPIEYKASRA